MEFHHFCHPDPELVHRLERRLEHLMATAAEVNSAADGVVAAAQALLADRQNAEQALAAAQATIADLQAQIGTLQDQVNAAVLPSDLDAAVAELTDLRARIDALGLPPAPTPEPPAEEPAPVV